MDRKMSNNRPLPPSRRRPPARLPVPSSLRSSSPESDYNTDSARAASGTPQTEPTYASVHRPRHPSIVAAIQREQQQKRMLQLQYQQQQQQRHHNGQQQYDPAVRAKLVDLNNRQQFQQPMAVSIPQPNQYQQKALALQQQMHPHQQQHHNLQPIHHHQQQQQIHFHHQQQQQLISAQSPQHKLPQQQSRIPSITSLAAPTITSQPTTNFNQISKTATNLLNDIYEKHLLNQTRFESASAMNNQTTVGSNSAFNGGPVGAAADGEFNLNGLTHQQYIHLQQQQQQHHHQHQLRQQNVAGEQNKLIPIVSYTLRGPNGGATTLAAGTELMIKNNQRQRVPRKISESVALKIQKSLCEKQSAAASAMMAASGGGMLAGRKQPPGGNEVNLCEPNYVHRTKTDVNLVYGGYEHSAAAQSKQYIQGSSGGGGGGNCDANGKISVRAEPVGGNNFYQDNVCEYGSVAGVAAAAASAALCVPNSGTTNNYEHRNSKINIMLETAQAMAAAAYFARAAQRMSNNNAATKSRVPEMPSTERGGFCGALQRTPPPMPAGLARRLANKDNFGLGKVKVMLRISDNAASDGGVPHYLCIDKKKRQVTLTDPSTLVAAASSQERGPMVAAPKMFAFDGLFTGDDTQSDVCSSALSEVIPAVLEGSDACLLTLGYPAAGQTKTMFGSVTATGDLGAIPCAIAWLYKGINERRQKSGSRFSVRVSALGVSATKPGSSSRDLLAAHKTESDESPSSYLRDDYLGGPTELRAPTAERAALFLDAAITGRNQSSNLEPALIFTLHVYQYSLGGKGAVAGGRSRLHLIDLGGCANRTGGLPLSGIGNVLLAILSGQRHPPNRDHPLTPLLKDCLAPLSCHVSVLAHVSHSQTHTDALTTIQLASRIHRMRRRKHRFPLPSDKQLGVNSTGNQSGSSEGPDPSSSDLSADTVIYMGPSDDATDGEHPPVYLPSMTSGDNRCSMNKALKGSAAEKPSKLPQKKTTQKPQSPVPAQRTDSLKRKVVNPSPVATNNISATATTAATNCTANAAAAAEIPSSSAYHYSAQQMQQHIQSGSTTMPHSPKIVAPYRHVASNVPTPKSSPLRRPNASNQGSPKRQITGEEQWVDGPRLSKSKVAEARHLLREINHVKQREQWIDGPKMSSPSKSLVAGALPTATSTTPGYGYMDSHKKTMIRQWVENQSSQIFPSGQEVSGQIQPPRQILQMTQFKSSDDDQHSQKSHQTGEMVNPTSMTYSQPIANSSSSSVRVGLRQTVECSDQKSERSVASSAQKHNDSQEEEDQDSGPSEVPPALPLLEPLSSREISHDSLHIMCTRHVSRESLGSHLIQTKDCGLQVTEDDIVKAMGDHPLSALSHGNVSVVSSFNHAGDAYSDCVNGDRTKHQFDQLARLREIYTSQLAMAEVVPAFRINDVCSVFSEPAYRFIAGPGSVCSEPAYRPPSPRCSGCRQSIGLSRTPSQTSLPSLNGIVAIAGMEQYASLRHPDGASDPNLQKSEQNASAHADQPSQQRLTPDHHSSLHKLPLINMSDHKVELHASTGTVNLASQTHLPQLAPLPLSTPEAYDSGHDSSTPRTSKHSGISRRAESGYHSVATVRDSDESSFGSGAYRGQRISAKKRSSRQDRSLCNWLRNPFTCTYPDTEGEISDF